MRAPVPVTPVLTKPALRAVRDLVGVAGETARSASMTLQLGPEPGEALALLRRVETVTRRSGLRQRIELRGRVATVHVWRE